MKRASLVITGLIPGWPISETLPQVPLFLVSLYFVKWHLPKHDNKSIAQGILSFTLIST